LKVFWKIFPEISELGAKECEGGEPASLELAKSKREETNE
jgi:hypothetical protein